LLVLVWV